MWVLLAKSQPEDSLFQVGNSLSKVTGHLSVSMCNPGGTQKVPVSN